MIIVGDGMADDPADQPQGQTPLEEAHKPGMDRLAAEGCCGLVKTLPEDMPPGSDVANMSILGYDPHLYYTGRGPLEAVAMGVLPAAGDFAYRCNLVCLEDGLMADYSAGHISTEDASAIIAELSDSLDLPGFSFYSGISYRHLLVWKAGALLQCHPPHDIQGLQTEAYLPRGQRAEDMLELMNRSAAIMRRSPVNQRRMEAGLRAATHIWPWGGGASPTLPDFRSRYGLSGAMITAVDLLRGLAICAGLRIIDVPGATGYLDTDYAAKGRYAVQALGSHELVFVHIEAPDEASHAGLRAEKTEAIESIDCHIVRPLLNLAERDGDLGILLLPDHATPLSTRTHCRLPVPFAMYPGPCQSAVDYSEKTALSGPYYASGEELLRAFLGRLAG